MGSDKHTLIVGGGLSGLSLARHLHLSGRPFQLIEARTRFGGRILSHQIEGQGFDLGPAWFWDGQPRIAKLVEELKLARFEQYSKGDLTYEDQMGVQRGRGYASMEGSHRLSGGFDAFIEALLATLPKDALHLGTTLTSLEYLEGGIRAVTDQGALNSDRLVLAIPPRIVSDLIFQPALPDIALKAMLEIPTWMAGHAKALAIYETPFWREAGLSGDAMSRVGPMMEIHDASPLDCGPFALFGFMGVPAEARRDQQALRAATLAQLERLFGPMAAKPTALEIKDWAFDPFTATPLDLAPISTHPSYGRPEALTDLWDGRLILGSTELASQFGGFLEGALEAAEMVFEMLERT